jgi:hypothetical protein
MDDPVRKSMYSPKAFRKERPSTAGRVPAWAWFLSGWVTHAAWPRIQAVLSQVTGS